LKITELNDWTDCIYCAKGLDWLHLLR